MAKIKYYKIKGKLPKTTKIDSITGEAYLDDFETRMDESRELSIERQKALLKSEEIILSKKENENNDNIDWNFDDESLEKCGDILKRFVDGEPKNVNPLKQIPKSEMKLYGIGINIFDTVSELKKYCKDNNLNLKNVYTLEYIREVAGRSDVVVKTNKDGKSIYYTVIDEDGYSIYNNERSIYRGEFIWEYNYGSISEMYSAFRNRGIVFEDDTYAKIAERDRRIFEMLEEHRKGPVLTKKKDHS